MANTLTFSGMGGVDTTAFKNFARALRRKAPELAVELRTNLRAAGNIIAEDARSRASFSTKIPGSIKVRVSAATVSIVAGGPKAPDAAPYENEGNEGDFRHPLFGDREHWYSQKARPFLHPAVEHGRAAAQAAAIDALDKAVKEVVLETG
jgi:hypothetical protein